MLVFSQEESRSISENVTWGQRKRFADGKVTMPYKRFLGYEKGEDGTPQIVESEAEIVRLIYKMFIEGKTSSAIAKHLTANHIPTPGGKVNWQVAVVDSILSNEKYKGDALLQKTFTVDFLSKTTKENEREVPQYYVENSHPAIIEPEEFDAVQIEIERRKKLGRPVACQSPLSTKLICGDCGGFYGAKVWGSNTKYRRVVWQCNNKYKTDVKCTTPHVTEDEVKEKFVEAFNSVLEYKEELIANCRLAKEALCDCREIDRGLEQLHQKVEIVAELSRKAIYENAHAAMNQDEWNKRNSSYFERHQKASERIAELEELKKERKSKSLAIDNFIKGLKMSGDVITEFDEGIWLVAVERVIVQPDGGLVFSFKDGTKLPI